MGSLNGFVGRIGTRNSAEHLDSVLWAALNEDTGCPVALLSADGTVLRCNGWMAALLGRASVEEVGGFTLGDFLPADVAAERTTLIARAAERGQPLTLDGILRGKLVRTSLRPVPQNDGELPQVLMICAPLTEDAGASDGVARATADDPDTLETLTTRELELLGLIGMGHSTAEIARKLHRSVKTVEGHRVSLGVKLGVTNRVQLARIAIRAGLAPLGALGLAAENAPAAGER